MDRRAVDAEGNKKFTYEYVSDEAKMSYTQKADTKRCKAAQVRQDRCCCCLHKDRYCCC